MLQSVALRCGTTLMFSYTAEAICATDQSDKSERWKDIIFYFEVVYLWRYYETNI